MKKAFSLVELSIVLVILGLLTGGILAGQSLIHAAELRAVSTEYQRYLVATRSFRDKYFAIPGDFNNAQAFWGQSTVCGGAAATGACNGNNDGQVTFAGTAGATAEGFQFWRQLALAGLIEGNYTGSAAAGSGYLHVANSNAPGSRFPSGVWCVFYTGVYAGDGTMYTLDFGNEFILGAVSTSVPGDPLLKPEDLWNIDTKLDDGKPGSGNVVARDAIGFGNAGSCTTSASKSDFTGSYNLSVTSPACDLYIRKQF